jgi:hypothetical protein
MKKASQSKPFCGAFYFRSISARSLRSKKSDHYEHARWLSRGQKNVRIGLIGMLASYLQTALRQNVNRNVFGD